MTQDLRLGLFFSIMGAGMIALAFKFRAETSKRPIATSEEWGNCVQNVLRKAERRTRTK